MTKLMRSQFDPVYKNIQAISNILRDVSTITIGMSTDGLPTSIYRITNHEIFIASILQGNIMVQTVHQ